MLFASVELVQRGLNLRSREDCRGAAEMPVALRLLRPIGARADRNALKTVSATWPSFNANLVDRFLIPRSLLLHEWLELIVILQHHRDLGSAFVLRPRYLAVLSILA